jgi:hypothetical protein
MTFLNRDLIRECLRELSDKNYQERVWTASSGPEISSLTEAVCQLFNDSALDLIIDKGPVFGDPVDAMLKKLRLLLKDVPDNRPPLEVINDPGMITIRELSRQILEDFPVKTGVEL